MVLNLGLDELEDLLLSLAEPGHGHGVCSLLVDRPVAGLLDSEHLFDTLMT